MDKGSLFDHLHERKTTAAPLDPKLLIRWLWEAALGLEYMHRACARIHRDIKSMNMLVCV